MALNGAGHEVGAVYLEARERSTKLRHVADLRIAPPHRRPEHLDQSGAWRHQPQKSAQQSRLTGTIRAEHTDELPSPDRERNIGENYPLAVGQCEAAQFDRVHAAGRESACSSESSCRLIQSG